MQSLCLEGEQGKEYCTFTVYYRHYDHFSAWPRVYALEASMGNVLVCCSIWFHLR